VSKLSKRAYSGAKELRSVRSGFGMTVLTTPKGVMSDRDARKNNIGGEVLFTIW
jgi:small subunit ribosomal protein S8